ncbi:MAG TPA: hypothetical protein VEO01_37810 [Pseudonocardiaceae bacterium]|nr:hypothetical protein [Pseudonocardiaceae bacterium]
MLIITIKADHSWNAPDELGRTRAGFRPGITDEELYEAARGSWVLGPQADREHYALVVHDGIVRQAIEIDRLVDTTGGRRAIEGTVLAPGHAVYDTYVGKESPVPPQRNPIRYFDSPVGHKRCRCGCGEDVPTGDFAVGHDQKALHDRVKRIGSVAEFLDWFDNLAAPFASGA